MANLDVKIEQTRQRLRDLQTKARKQQRRDETRRLILYGAAALALAKELESDRRDRFLIRVQSKITRPSDREFLGLEEKQVSSS
ncbi:hypothetical protein [Falsiruegeria mediterranea]